jgi:hypothetical protein
MWRIHVPDIGVVAIQNHLAATGDIDPGHLTNTGTLAHLAPSLLAISSDGGCFVKFGGRGDRRKDPTDQTQSGRIIQAV